MTAISAFVSTSIRRTATAANWITGLMLLLLALTAAVVCDYGPAIGRALGRLAGAAYRHGRQTRRRFELHLLPVLTPLALHLDYSARTFICRQCGDTCIALQQAIAPSWLLQLRIDELDDSSSAPATPPAPSRPATRRHLLQLAREQSLKGYSRMTTAALRAALLTAS